MSGQTKVTRELLEQAAKLRGKGATWNAIREATGTKLGSSQWFRHWEQEGIEHRKAGESKPKPAAVEPAVAPASTKKAATASRPPRSAAKGQSAPKTKAGKSRASA